MYRKLILALFLSAVGLLAQGPNCAFTYTFTSASAGAAVANKPTSTGGTPCLYWEVMYWTNGATGVSLQMEGTNDTSGSAGASYTALTAINGTNPATGTAQGQIILCCDYYPWNRINATTFTGSNLSMTVRVYGWFTPPGSGGSGPTAIANMNLQQVNGTTVDTNGNGDQGVINSCTQFAVFNLSGSGNTQIVAASATKKIIVCSVIFATGTPEDVKFTEGTGSNCASGTADASGLYKNISAFAHDALGLPYTATASDALCLNQPNTQALGGTIWYRYQ